MTMACLPVHLFCLNVWYGIVQIVLKCLLLFSRFWHCTVLYRSATYSMFILLALLACLVLPCICLMVSYCILLQNNIYIYIYTIQSIV